jgi:DNA processing protein
LPAWGRFEPLKIENLAALLVLADVRRAEVSELSSKLARLGETQVEAVLDRATLGATGSEARLSGEGSERILSAELSRSQISMRVGLLDRYRRSGIRAISLWDPDYPDSLRKTATPPLVILVRGSTFPGERRIAIVGTRRATDEGKSAAREYAQALAAQGWTIVSGLARGIDTSAHAGAIDVGGTTLGVTAGHIEYVYPPENHELYDRVRLSGALVSEVTPFAPIHRGRFIERNRITSGLSEAVIIPEFHGTGGTLQQARFALEQGRPILTIRKGAGSLASARKGVDMLLAMGATAVGEPEEVPSAIQAGTEANIRRRATASRPSQRVLDEQSATR